MLGDKTIGRGKHVPASLIRTLDTARPLDPSTARGRAKGEPEVRPFTLLNTHSWRPIPLETSNDQIISLLPRDDLESHGILLGVWAYHLSGLSGRG